jgi:hypothetical protein
MIAPNTTKDTIRRARAEISFVAQSARIEDEAYLIGKLRNADTLLSSALAQIDRIAPRATMPMTPEEASAITRVLNYGIARAGNGPWMSMPLDSADLRIAKDAWNKFTVNFEAAPEATTREPGPNDPDPSEITLTDIARAIVAVSDDLTNNPNAGIRALRAKLDPDQHAFIGLRREQWDALRAYLVSNNFLIAASIIRACLHDTPGDHVRIAESAFHPHALVKIKEWITRQPAEPAREDAATPGYRVTITTQTERDRDSILNVLSLSTRPVDIQVHAEATKS